MAKLTYKDKKEIIKLYDKKHLEYVLIARKMKVNPKVVERIIRKFHIHGEASLIKRKAENILKKTSLKSCKKY